MKIWPRRKQTPDEARQARRAAAVRPPKRIFRGVELSPFSRLRKPQWRRRLIALAAWPLGAAAITWGLADLVGPWAWKVAAGVALISIGGWVSFLRVVVFGLVICPVRDWFREMEESEDAPSPERKT